MILTHGQEVIKADLKVQLTDYGNRPRMPEEERDAQVCPEPKSQIKGVGLNLLFLHILKKECFLKHMFSLGYHGYRIFIFV